MVIFLTIVLTLLQIYYYILIMYILLSWIPEIRTTKFYYYVHLIADPYMRLFRGIIVIGQMDFTPIVGFLLYGFGLNYFRAFVQSIIG